MQKLDSGETLEIVTFAGIESTNRTKAADQNLFSRPIGKQRDALNGISVPVPLSHRVVMRFDGLVEHRWVDQFLTVTDIEALRAHFDWAQGTKNPAEQNVRRGPFAECI